MSDESDSFIREVTEEVRADRARGLWKRFGPLVIGALIAIVLVAGVDAFLTHQRETAAREAGSALIAATASADPAARAEALAAAAPQLDPGPALIARLQQAGEMAATGKAQEARSLYTEIAETTEPGPFMELAALRAAMLSAQIDGAQAGVDALRPLTAGSRPFRLLALEAMGSAQLAAGDAAGARASFEQALADKGASEGLTARLTQLMAAAGGDAAQEN